MDSSNLGGQFCRGCEFYHFASISDIYSLLFAGEGALGWPSLAVPDDQDLPFVQLGTAFVSSSMSELAFQEQSQGLGASVNGTYLTPISRLRVTLPLTSLSTTQMYWLPPKKLWPPPLSSTGMNNRPGLFSWSMRSL